MRLASWFHDAVHDPRAADNEDRSAHLAGDVLRWLAFAPARVREVARLVRLAAGPDPRPGDANGALLVDADLAILAADAEHDDRYAQQIRREYRHVTDAAFAAARTALLRRLAGDSLVPAPARPRRAAGPGQRGHAERGWPVSRAVDRAIGDRVTGPILRNQHGRRTDRHAATRRRKHLAAMAGVRIPRMHPHMLRHTFVTTMRHAGPAPTSTGTPTTSSPRSWPSGA